MKHFRRIASIVLVLVCGASLALTLFGVYRYHAYERGIVEPLKEDLIRRTRDAAARIETSLAPAREAVFSHIGARQKIAAPEIIYLEYFCVVMYFAILWVAVNSILFVRWPGSKFIQYEKHLLPQVLFWPVTLGALWLLTLRTFY